MCGIVGFSGPWQKDLLIRMSARIAHRGPDGDGLIHLPEEGIGLAHRRLAIIDVSPAGAQPMWDELGQTCIVFNGEIYNFRELRAELEAAGCSFRSRSDTEVLLKLYLRDQEACLERLNGIFAFALWDVAKRHLFIARDGLGVKPLYYAENGNGLLFASELKALLQEPTVSRRIDPLAVVQHLAYLWCPAPRTMLAGVRKLEPGHAMIVRQGRIARSWCFYDLPKGADHPAWNTDNASSALHDHLDQAVRRQMVADVPVGAFLSGGLDSSTIVSFARRHTPRRLQCFTIGLEGEGMRPEGAADDLLFARQVAAHLDVDLHVVNVGPQMVDSLSDMIYHLDEPQADPAPLNALFISRLARDHGIKVLLSGAGGDDLLTGYRRHFALQQERYWAWLPRGARQQLARLVGGLHPRSPLARRLRKAFEYAALPGQARIVHYLFWLNPDRVCSLLAPDLRSALEPAAIAAPLVAALGQLPPESTRLERMLYLEGKFFLPDHNLNYTDKMGMAAGVEVRVPFLDPDLVALAARFPDHMKQRGPQGKWILKKAMEPDLPREVIYRPKTGFGAPLRRWLRHELRPMVDATLSEPVIQRRGLFDPAAVRQLVEEDRYGRVDAAYTIFGLVCIELWCQLFLA